VDLDSSFYKLVGQFDERFPEGAPSLRQATSLVVHGDWTFGRDVVVVGEVELDEPGDGAGRVEPGTALGAR
jgi:UTP--glucose-1-phosphate uridylyltransferase